MFSPVVTDHWFPGDGRACAHGSAVVVVDPGLPESRSVSLMRARDGSRVLALSPDRAGGLRLTDGACVDEVGLAHRLERAGVHLHDPDLVHHLPLAEQATLRAEDRGAGTCALTVADTAAFAAFTAAAPAGDLDEAFVELDHWLVVGTFVGGTLASVASLYPWRGSRLADLGVLTLPAFRGHGTGRATVRAASADALARGYEPLYRCRRDNTASVRLARAAGYAVFGEWRVLDADA